MAVPCPGLGWEPNPGRQPDHTIGKRVAVVLANGDQTRVEPVTTTAPAGWAADKARWTKSRPEFQYDIAWFKVL